MAGTWTKRSPGMVNVAVMNEGSVRWDIVFYFFYWNIVDLQYCANLCCTAKWLSYTHICIFFYLLFHYGSSQYLHYSSWCYRLRPCCLFITNVIVCIYQPYIPVHCLLPLATTSLSSKAMSLFLFCRQVHLCHILDSTHKWYYEMCLSLLTYFT